MKSLLSQGNKRNSVTFHAGYMTRGRRTTTAPEHDRFSSNYKKNTSLGKLSLWNHPEKHKSYKKKAKKFSQKRFDSGKIIIFAHRPRTTFCTAQVLSTSQGFSSESVWASALPSFLEKKEESFSNDIQFLEAWISSAKHESARLQQKCSEYDQAAPIWAKTCTNCHLTGHQKRHCKNPPCPRIIQCNLQSTHPEVKSEAPFTRVRTITGRTTTVWVLPLQWCGEPLNQGILVKSRWVPIVSTLSC